MDPQQLPKTSTFYSICNKCDMQKTVGVGTPLVAWRLTLQDSAAVPCRGVARKLFMVFEISEVSIILERIFMRFQSFITGTDSFRSWTRKRPLTYMYANGAWAIVREEDACELNNRWCFQIFFISVENPTGSFKKINRVEVMRRYWNKVYIKCKFD